MQSEVAVIGAGLAGLYACRLLQAVGVNFVLLEARECLGGRILTVDESGQSSDDGFDLGPSWYWSAMQPAIGNWAADPLTATAADRGAGGHIMADDAPWVTGAWQDRLALGGSPTEPGYLAGAVEAARQAFAETLHKIDAVTDLPGG
jgi:monoamine oxidase